MRLLHIVPRLPPEIDGIGDFALMLGEQLAARTGVESRFLSADSAQARPDAGAVLSEQLALSLSCEARAMDCEALMLHYAGYGYDRRGVPTWLAEGIETLAREVPVFIFFHELWTETKPWRTAFYFAPAQKRLTARLQRAAAGTMTSTPGMRRRLSDMGQTPELAAIPSFVSPPPRAIAASWGFRIAVFGRPHTRERSIRAHDALLSALAGSDRIESLRLIGEAASAKSADGKLALALVGPNRVQLASDLSANEIGRELSESSFCLSFYPLDYLTKSSTIMAALACGCPVVLPPQQGSEEFQPRPPVILLDGTEEAIQRELAFEKLERVSREGQAWYRLNADWPRLIDRLAPMIESARAGVAA